MNLSRPVILAALAGLVAAPAIADRPRVERDPFGDYVRARVADDLGELSVAASGFAVAAAENPDDAGLALRAFRQAVAAGDMALALRTARALDARQSLPPDGTLLLLSDAIQRRDWKQADALGLRIEGEKLFAFMLPVVRGWIALGRHGGDPLAPVEAVAPGTLAYTYSAEHRIFLAIASGKTEAGLAALNALQLPDGGRAARLRTAVAASLARHGKRDAALALLTDDSPPVRRAREVLETRRALSGAIDTPAAGIAELFVRVAADINKQQAAPLALHFARLASMLAPDDSEAWLVTANLLSLAGADEAALEALGHVGAADPFIGAARDLRLTLLVRAGHQDRALTEAQAATTSPQVTYGDWARYADLLTGADRFAEAARAYGTALDMAGGDKAPAEVAWPLLLQQASALLQSGDWPTSRVKAERALALAPERPEVLNFLGYSRLEHGEDVPGASAMIAKASALAPDDPSITDSLGWSWFMRGQVDRAIPLLERAARGAPAESDINEHLGDAYWKADRRLDARYAWRAALVAAEGEQAARLKAKIDYGISAKP